MATHTITIRSREARDKLAEVLRHFGSGQISTGELIEQANSIAESTLDRAVAGVASELLSIYDAEPRPKDYESRRHFARAIAFLKTDLDYGWPDDGWCGWVHVLGLLTSLATFCLACWVFPLSAWSLPAFLCTLVCWLVFGLLVPRAYYRRWHASGDTDVWPFISHHDHEQALRNPRYLNGPRVS